MLGWLLRPLYYPESHGLVPGGNTIANGRATWDRFRLRDVLEMA